MHGICSLDDSQLVAVMLYTAQDQELFRDIKTNVTGKKMDWKKFRGRDDEEEFQKYHRWKQDYE